jgi:hypothetical protein
MQQIDLRIPINLNIPKGAIFSEDRKYRYALWRVWNPNGGILMITGLNPSTASEVEGDPTVTRCVTRAERAGYGGFFMANLFGLVSTDPKELLRNQNAVGELTDYYLKEMIKLSQRHVVAWGSFKPVVKRCDAVLAMIREPYCLGVNQDGQPKHPLYIGYDKPMVRYIKTP